MKFIKKICAKIAGVAKYLVYMGKLIQALKVLAGIMPQLASMVKPEQQKVVGEIAETLNKIAGKMEVTEKYLNDMGVVTSTEGLQKRAGEKLTIRRASNMLSKIDESI